VSYVVASGHPWKHCARWPQGLLFGREITGWCVGLGWGRDRKKGSYCTFLCLSNHQYRTRNERNDRRMH
jgi:hypothetical protein